jgi:putative oxidoreductase
MQKNKWILIACLGLSLTGCVQKAYLKTVVFTLRVANKQSVQTVAIRGNDKPLSWNTDIPMLPIKADSLYRGVVQIPTGYTFTEVKFVVNGEFELQDKANRRVNFSKGDTTYYDAVFDKN